MVLKKSKIKIPYIRLNFQIVRQSDARWCERSKIPHQEEFSPTRFLKEKYENKFKAYYTYEKGKNYTFLLIKIENVDLYKNQIKI